MVETSPRHAKTLQPKTVSRQRGLVKGYSAEPKPLRALGNASSTCAQTRARSGCPEPATTSHSARDDRQDSPRATCLTPVSLCHYNCSRLGTLEQSRARVCGLVRPWDGLSRARLVAVWRRHPTRLEHTRSRLCSMWTRQSVHSEQTRSPSQDANAAFFRNGT